MAASKDEESGVPGMPVTILSVYPALRIVITTKESLRMLSRAKQWGIDISGKLVLPGANPSVR